MDKRVGLFLCGFTVAMSALGADEQPIRVTADAIHHSQKTSTTDLLGHAVVTLRTGAPQTMSALHISHNQATGETVLEGNAKVKLQSAELSGDQLAVKTLADGVVEVSGDRVRMVSAVSR